MGNTYTTTTSNCGSDDSTPKSSHYERDRCEKCNRSECFARVIAAQNASRHKSYGNFCVPGTIYFRPQLGPNIYTNSTPLLSSNGITPYGPTTKTPLAPEKFHRFSPGYSNDEPKRKSKGNDEDSPSSQDSDSEPIPNRSPGVLKDENRNNIERKPVYEATSSSEKPLQVQNETSRPAKSEDAAPGHDRPAEKLGGDLPGSKVNDTNDGTEDYGNSGPFGQPDSSSTDYTGYDGGSDDQSYGRGGGFDPIVGQPTLSKPFNGASTDGKPSPGYNRHSTNSVQENSPAISRVPSGFAGSPNKAIFTGTNSTPGPRTGTSNQEINATGPQRRMSSNKAPSIRHNVPEFEAIGPDSSVMNPQTSVVDYGAPVLESGVDDEQSKRNRRQDEGEEIDARAPSSAPASRPGSFGRPKSSPDGGGDPKVRVPLISGPIPSGNNSQSTTPRASSQSSPDSTSLYAGISPQKTSIPSESAPIGGLPGFDKPVGGKGTPGQTLPRTNDLRSHSSSYSEPGSRDRVGPNGTNGAVESSPTQSDAQTGGVLEFKKGQGSRSSENSDGDFGTNMSPPSTQNDRVPSTGVGKGNVVPEGGKATPASSIGNSGAPIGTKTVSEDDDLQPSLGGPGYHGLPYTGRSDPVKNGRVGSDERLSVTKPPPHAGDENNLGQREPNLNSADLQVGNDPTRGQASSGAPKKTPQSKLQQPSGLNNTGGRGPEGSTRRETEPSPESTNHGGTADAVPYATELFGGRGSNYETPVVAKGFPTNEIKPHQKGENKGVEVIGSRLPGLDPSGGKKKDSGVAPGAPNTGITGPKQGTKQDKGVPDGRENIPLDGSLDNPLQRSHIETNGVPHSDAHRPSNREGRPFYEKPYAEAAFLHPGKDSLVPSVGGKDSGRDSSLSGPALRADKSIEATVPEDSNGGNNISTGPAEEMGHPKQQTSVPPRSSAGTSLEPSMYPSQQRPSDVSTEEAKPVNPNGTRQDVLHGPATGPYAGEGPRIEERKTLDGNGFVSDNVPSGTTTGIALQQPTSNRDDSLTRPQVPTRTQRIQEDDNRAPILSSAVGYPDSFDHNRKPNYEDGPTSSTPRITIGNDVTTPKQAGKLTEIGREHDQRDTPSANNDAATSPNDKEPASVSQATQSATDPNHRSSVPDHKLYPTSAPIPLATMEPPHSRDSGTSPGIPVQTISNPSHTDNGDGINPTVPSVLPHTMDNEPSFNGSVQLPSTDHRLGPSYPGSQKTDGATLDDVEESTGDDYSYQQHPSKDAESIQEPSLGATTTVKTDSDAGTTPTSGNGAQNYVPSEKSGSPFSDQSNAKIAQPTQTTAGGNPSHSKQRKPVDRFPISPRPVTYSGRPVSRPNEQAPSRPMTQPKSFPYGAKKKTGQSTGHDRHTGCSPYSMPLKLPQRLSKKNLGSVCCIKDPCLAKLDTLVANNNCCRQNKQRTCILPPNGIKLADFIKEVDTVNDRKSKRKRKQPARRIQSDAEMMSCLAEQKQDRPLSRPEVPSAFTVIYPSTSGQCPPGTVRRKDGFFAVPKREKEKSKDAWYQNEDDSYNRTVLSNCFEGTKRKGSKKTSRVSSSQRIPPIPQNNGNRMNASSLDHLRDIQFTDLPAGLKDSIKKLQNDYEQYIRVCNKVASELNYSARQPRLNLMQPEPIRITVPSNRRFTENRENGSALLCCPDPDPCSMMNTCTPCRMQICPCPCAVCPPPKCVPAYCVCSAENVQLDDDAAIISAQNSSTKTDEKQDIVMEDRISNTELALQQVLGPAANSDCLSSVSYSSSSNALNEHSTHELNAWMNRLRQKLATGMEFQLGPREQLFSASSNADSTCDARNSNHMKNSRHIPSPSASEANKAHKDENIFDVLQNIDNALQSPDDSIQVSCTDVTTSSGPTFESNIGLNHSVESNGSIKLPCIEDQSGQPSVASSTCATSVLRANLKTKESNTKPVIRVRFSNPVVKDCWTMSPQADTDDGQRLQITVDKNKNYKVEDGQKSKRRQHQ